MLLICLDIAELDISALNMIVCRDTLSVKSEMEVFVALQRWSYRECRRQRLPITGHNRRKVLEGAQYLVRYLTLSREEFISGPYRSGVLRKSEEDALLAQINCKGSAKATAEAVKLPDHLWHCQTMMITRRKGPQPPQGGGLSLSSKRYMPGMSRKKRNQKLYRQQQRRKAKALKAEANAKEKFNLVEEFFICLACIFD